jgi:hypothetical protein
LKRCGQIGGPGWVMAASSNPYPADVPVGHTAPAAPGPAAAPPDPALLRGNRSMASGATHGPRRAAPGSCNDASPWPTNHALERGHLPKELMPWLSRASKQDGPRGRVRRRVDARAGRSRWMEQRGDPRPGFTGRRRDDGGRGRRHTVHHVGMHDHSPRPRPRPRLRKRGGVSPVIQEADLVPGTCRGDAPA